MRRLALVISLFVIAAPALHAAQLPPPSQAPTIAAPAQTLPPPTAQTPRPATPGVATAAPTGQQAPPARPGVTAPAGVAQAGPPLASSWQNVKLDVTISDSLSADFKNTKAVSMLILDGRSGQVRSAGGQGIINLDARPAIRPDGRIYVQLTLEYRPDLTSQELQRAGTNPTSFTESLALIVADGRPTVASESADPRSDRKVTLTVTATVVK